MPAAPCDPAADAVKAEERLCCIAVVGITPDSAGRKFVNGKHAVVQVAGQIPAGRPRKDPLDAAFIGQRIQIRTLAIARKRQTLRHGPVQQVMR